MPIGPTSDGKWLWRGCGPSFPNALVTARVQAPRRWLNWHFWLGSPTSGRRSAGLPRAGLTAHPRAWHLQFPPLRGDASVCLSTLIQLKWRASRIPCGVKRRGPGTSSSAAVLVRVWSQSLGRRAIHFNYTRGTCALLQHMALVKPGACVSRQARLRRPGTWFRKSFANSGCGALLEGCCVTAPSWR